MMKDYKGEEFDINSLYPLKYLCRPKPYVPIDVKRKFEAGDKEGIKAMRKIAKRYMNSLYGRKGTVKG